MSDRDKVWEKEIEIDIRKLLRYNVWERKRKSEI